MKNNQINVDKYDKVLCLLCNKKFYRVTNTHLWKEHQISMQEYIIKFPNAQIEDKQLSIDRNSKLRGKTYDDIYGPVKALELIMQREEMIKKDWDAKPEKKEMMRKKFTGRNLNPSTKQKISLSHKKEWTTYRERALAFYGSECQKCGSTEKLHVHHIDNRNHRSSLGNHKLENLMVLCDRCHSKIHNELRPGYYIGVPKIEQATVLLLEALKEEFGLDISDENFKDTPKRVSRAYYEIFNGINSMESIKRDILSTSFPSEYKGMITVTNIKCFSMCPHHLLPVEYVIDIGYIPGEKTLGISKLSRLVESLAKAPMLQEDLTKKIIDVLQYIKPIGSMVLVKGRHFCMSMRGVEKTDAWTITSEVSGVFLEDKKGKTNAKDEFLRLIGR